MIDLYDLEKLEEAKDLVDRVYCYNFGCGQDRKIVSRLDTIGKKLEEVIEIARKERKGK